MLQKHFLRKGKIPLYIMGETIKEFGMKKSYINEMKYIIRDDYSIDYMLLRPSDQRKLFKNYCQSLIFE